jgi:anti-anti-sigma factor
VVAVRGEVDLSTAEAVDKAVHVAVQDGWRHLVVDLRGVDFMDSTGLHLLVRLSERRRRGVRVELIAGNPAVERLLELSGLTDVLPRADAFSVDATAVPEPMLPVSDFVARMLNQRAAQQASPSSPGTAA